MKAKHTQGEWHAQHTGGHDIHGQSVVYADGAGRGRDVAIVYNGDADAHLISAAPDLLWAAQCILQDLNAIMPHDLVKHFGASRMLLLNACAKAKGEA